MHDISKLLPEHQQAYKDFIASEYTPNEVPDQLYNVWLALRDIPKKDWSKPSTTQQIRTVVDEN